MQAYQKLFSWPYAIDLITVLKYSRFNTNHNVPLFYSRFLWNTSTVRYEQCFGVGYMNLST